MTRAIWPPSSNQATWGSSLTRRTRCPRSRPLRGRRSRRPTRDRRRSGAASSAHGEAGEVSSGVAGRVARRQQEHGGERHGVRADATKTHGGSHAAMLAGDGRNGGIAAHRGPPRRPPHRRVACRHEQPGTRPGRAGVPARGALGPGRPGARRARRAARRSAGDERAPHAPPARPHDDRRVVLRRPLRPRRRRDIRGHGRAAAPAHGAADRELAVRGRDRAPRQRRAATRWCVPAR